jgi:hypothetical protein
MKNKLLLFALLCSSLLVVSCNQKSNNQIKETEVWKLGWRMIANSMEEKYEIADLQFDSLLSLPHKIEKNFIVAGLEVKTKLEKNDGVIEILNDQDEETLKDICTKQFLANFKLCQGLSDEKIKNKPLQLELVKMWINDQYVRSNLMQDLLEKYHLKKNEVIIDSFGVETDERNRIRLKEMIDEFGFPTKNLVGKDGMEAVFYIIQHANGDKPWQKSQLKNIEEAVRRGDMEGQDYAYLYDRIKVNSKEKQLYGTQIAKVDPINKTVELAETEDIENLDKRRRQMGIMPIEMYKNVITRNL